MKPDSERKKSGVLKIISDLRDTVMHHDLWAADSGNTHYGEEMLPLLPLHDLVLFPQTVVPLFITFERGIDALAEAMRRENRLFAACLKKREDGLVSSETWPTGTVVRIIQNLKLPDNSYRVVLQCEYRAKILNTEMHEKWTLVRIEPIQAVEFSNPPDSPDTALMRSLQKSFIQYAEYSKKISTDTILAVERTENPERLANLICNSAALKSEKKVELLSISDTRKRLETIIETLEMENEIYGIQKNISGKIKSRMDKHHRDYILHEQLKEINRELGKDKHEDEYAELEKSITDKKPPAEVMVKAGKEIARLRKLQSFSPEAGVLRGYLEWIADLPWNESSSEFGFDSISLEEAESILNEDHFGMQKAKERVLEFIAVRQLLAGGGGQAAVDNKTPPYNTNEMYQDSNTNSSHLIPNSSFSAPLSIKGPILCFVGPPGTGKTSLGKSVARALGRRFIRISLGGVRDEAEIRGHRKTYVGALPGKIIQSMRKAGTVNPVFLLDEIDKLSHDFRGDPASALLEVLDPEQNANFSDHYLEVPYNLSRVLFITTANSLHTIPYPLLDRMEIIEVPGYGENEKLAIAKQFLVPKELRENGLACARINFKDEALLNIIRYWTMESGVRSLEREIARCIRRIARYAVKRGYGKWNDAAAGIPAPAANPDGLPARLPDFIEQQTEASKPISSFHKTIRPQDLEKLLGRRKYKNDVVYKEARIGVSYGLAWTETGGAILPVETTRFNGSGEFVITGNLGDVMKESARIALSYLRSVKDRYCWTVSDLNKSDFHVHVPEGAIPKDGPSAGITLAASLLSTLCRKAPCPGTAMTGELTLTGRILPIGGLKEKMLAAIRSGMDRVILPKDNNNEWAELDKDIREAIGVEFVENADEAFLLLFDNSILKKKQMPKKVQGKKKAARNLFSGQPINTPKTV